MVFLALFYLDGTVFFLNIISIGLGKYDYIRISYILSYLFIKPIFMILLYYFLLLISIQTKNIKLYKWLKVFRNNNELKIKVFLFSVFIIPVIAIIYWTLFYNINTVFELFKDLILHIIFLSPAQSIIILYIVWFIWDFCKKQIVKNNNTLIKNPEPKIDLYRKIDIKKEDYLKELNNINLWIFFILTFVTKYFYMIFELFHLQKIINKISDIKISYKYCLYPMITWILLIGSSITINHYSNIKNYILGTIPTEYLYISCILFGLIYLYIFYLYVDKVLQILVYIAKKSYNKKIKYDRIYAYLFGVFYLYFFIKTYRNRLSYAKVMV